MKEPGQIVLFQFPRADLSEGKLRPALLLCEVPGPYDDWLICMISSQIHQRIEGFDELIAEDDRDFTQSGLKTRSVIRIGRLAVVEGRILEGAIGQISPERLQGIRRRLAEWITDGENR
ncbi:MAG: PemK family protein [Bacteroidetes bacterium SW_8_64_56]|jgi:mRNA interferase MazF|nr:MAG: PemK family protein [Bacteroidetes bacterium SW_8_64_56]